MTITSGITLPEHHPFAGRNVASVLEQRVEAFADRRFLVWEPSRGLGDPTNTEPSPGLGDPTNTEPSRGLGDQSNTEPSRGLGDQSNTEPSRGPGDRREWSYADFGADVDRIAAGLTQRGVGRGDGVMLFLENSPAFLMCWFACARIGAVAIDTNVRYVADEVEHAAELTQPVGVITHQHLLDRVECVASKGWVATIDEVTGTCPELESDPADLPAIRIDPAEALCVQFTSGTTSRPKAAVYTHANALWAAMVGTSHNRSHRDDVVLVHAPLFHTMAMFWQTMPTFWVGGTVVLTPKYSRTHFWDISLRNGCTHTFFLALMLALAEEPIPEHNYKTWISGLALPAVEELFDVGIQSCWGMTEVVTNVIVNDPEVAGTEGTIGRVSPEYQLRVVPQEGEAPGDGLAQGELRIGGVRGLSLFAGYHRNAEATAEGFDADGFWCTGDLVKLRETGEVQFVSRIKDMLRVGGENVAAAEIERVLVEHPEVKAAGVVGYPDPIRGEVPFAFVVAPGAPSDEISDDLTAHCRQHLADFKVPRRVQVLDELPESLIGKTSKKLLAELAQEIGL